jgi:hypothetical protein
MLAAKFRLSSDDLSPRVGRVLCAASAAVGHSDVPAARFGASGRAAADATERQSARRLLARALQRRHRCVPNGVTVADPRILLFHLQRDVVVQSTGAVLLSTKMDIGPDRRVDRAHARPAPLTDIANEMGRV